MLSFAKTDLSQQGCIAGAPSLKRQLPATVSGALVRQRGLPGSFESNSDLSGRLPLHKFPQTRLIKPRKSPVSQGCRRIFEESAHARFVSGGHSC